MVKLTSIDKLVVATKNRKMKSFHFEERIILLVGAAVVAVNGFF